MSYCCFFVQILCRVVLIRHAELVSASACYLYNIRKQMLKQVQHDALRILVQHDAEG